MGPVRFMDQLPLGPIPRRPGGAGGGRPQYRGSGRGRRVKKETTAARWAFR